MVSLLVAEVGRKVHLVNDTNQTQNLNLVHSKDELAVGFANIALKFDSEGCSLPIIHVLGELCQGRFHMAFRGLFNFPFNPHSVSRGRMSRLLRFDTAVKIDQQPDCNGSSRLYHSL